MNKHWQSEDLGNEPRFQLIRFWLTVLTKRETTQDHLLVWSLWCVCQTWWLHQGSKIRSGMSKLYPEHSEAVSLIKKTTHYLNDILEFINES